MNRPRCPGQDMRFWKPGDVFEVRCAHCGAAVEFFKDEPALPCPSCRREIRNPKIDLGCAKWCKYASQCLDPPGQPDQPLTPLADRLIAAIESVFGHDAEGLARGQAALAFASRIQPAEGGSPLVVRAAVLVHELAGHGRAAYCRPFDEDDPCQTRLILERLGVQPADVQRICQTVWAIQTGLESETVEFRVAWDAAQLARLQRTAGEQAAGLASAMRTARGAELARELLAGRS